MSKSILAEADELVNGSRAKDYGDALELHTQIAKMWETILEVKVTAEEVVLCMIGLKITREMFKHKRDNLVDIAGYAWVLQRIHELKGGKHGPSID